MTYTLNAHNGFTEKFEADTLQEAKDYADNAIGYTQENLSIEVDGEPIAVRRWWGIVPDTDDDGDIICFGSYGYYSEWEDV